MSTPALTQGSTCTVTMGGQSTNVTLESLIYGSGGMGGGMNMNMLRQAQKMQEDMKAKQAELEAAEYTGSASGEMVTVKMNGKHEVLAITIKPEAVDPDDIEMLEDLVAAAVNATVKQVDETAEAEMGKLTGGMNIPGL